MGLVGLELWNLWVAAGVVAGFQVGAFRCDVICHLPARRHWGRGFGAAQLLNEPAALDRVEETPLHRQTVWTTTFMMPTILRKKLQSKTR